MAPLNPIRIRLRYADLETFVEKFAPNVTRGGVFLATRNIQPIGTVVPFEIQLMGGETALSGQGRVSWIKEFNPGEPNRPYGMGMQFVNIGATSKSVLARLLRAKEASGASRGSTTTGPLVPLGVSPRGSDSSASSANARNGVPAAIPVDTSVDLAAEYGIEEQTVRRLMERTWLMGARASDDLSDLLRPDPIETATLAQALSELPRLLDPQYSRRRTSSALRSLDWRGATGESAVPAPSPLPAQDVGERRREDDTIAQTLSSANTEEEPSDAPADSQEGGAVDNGDLAETTDMTGERSLEKIPQIQINGNGNGNGTSNGHRER